MKYIILAAALFAGFAALLSAQNGAIAAQNPNVCPDGNGWVKKDKLKGLTYTFTDVIPVGYVLTENCMKVGNHDPIYGTGPTVTNSTLFNKPECTVVGQGCNLQDISHASFKLEKEGEPEVCKDEKANNYLDEGECKYDDKDEEKDNSTPTPTPETKKDPKHSALGYEVRCEWNHVLVTFDVKENDDPIKDRQVTFKYDGKESKTRTNNEGRAVVSFDLASENVAVYAEIEDYPNQASLVELPICDGVGGQILGVSTFADTGSVNHLASLASVMMVAVGGYLTKRNVYRA